MDLAKNKTIYERKLKVLHFNENSAIFINNMSVFELNGKGMGISGLILIEIFKHLNWYLALIIKYFNFFNSMFY